MYLPLFMGVKEAANRIGFGETVAIEGPGSDALGAASELKSACSRTIQTPARDYLFALGRITVDAREKE